MRSELTYKGIEIDDEQYNAEFKVEDLDEVLPYYERVKYSDVDFALRPSEEDMAEELVTDLVSAIEDNEGDNEISIGYTNRDTGNTERLFFKYTIEYDVLSHVNVNVTFGSLSVQYNELSDGGMI